METLLRHAADVNARDKNWQTPLHVAAANNSVKCAEYLIPLLTNVNISDRSGRTALHHAAFNGHVEVGVPETSTSNTTLTLVFHSQMTMMLLDKGANINAFDKRDRRAVHYAAYMGAMEVVKLLLDRGAEPGCLDKQVCCYM